MRTGVVTHLTERTVSRGAHGRFGAGTLSSSGASNAAVAAHIQKVLEAAARMADKQAKAQAKAARKTVKAEAKAAKTAAKGA